MELGKRKQVQEIGLLGTNLVSIRDDLFGDVATDSGQPVAFTHGGFDYTEWSCHFSECWSETRNLAQVIAML